MRIRSSKDNATVNAIPKHYTNPTSYSTIITFVINHHRRQNCRASLDRGNTLRVRKRLSDRSNLDRVALCNNIGNDYRFKLQGQLVCAKVRRPSKPNHACCILMRYFPIMLPCVSQMFIG